MTHACVNHLCLDWCVTSPDTTRVFWRFHFHTFLRMLSLNISSGIRPLIWYYFYGWLSILSIRMENLSKSRHFQFGWISISWTSLIITLLKQYWKPGMIWTTKPIIFHCVSVNSDAWDTTTFWGAWCQGRWHIRYVLIGLYLLIVCVTFIMWTSLICHYIVELLLRVLFRSIQPTSTNHFSNRQTFIKNRYLRHTGKICALSTCIYWCVVAACLFVVRFNLGIIKKLMKMIQQLVPI